MIDLRDLRTRHTRPGYELQCPECGDWSRTLLVLEGGGLLCRGCFRAGESVGEDEQVEHAEVIA
jgi:hypothetical protein